MDGIFSFFFISHATTTISWFDITCVRCGLWLSCRVSALHPLVPGSISRGGRSRHTLLMRPNKVETGVPCFRMSRTSFHRVFLVMVIQFTLLNLYIGPYQTPSLWEVGAMTRKWYSIFAKAPNLDPHHQIV